MARVGRYLRDFDEHGLKKYGVGYVSSFDLTPEERAKVTQKFGVVNRDTRPEVHDAIQQYQQQLWGLRNTAGA